MSDKLSTLEDFMKQYIANKATSQKADSFDTYKHRTGANHERSFAKTVESLYSSTSKTGSGYGQNYQNLANKGLQNSGYSEYIDAMSDRSFKEGLTTLKAERDLAELKTLGGYSDYLNRYAKEQNAIKESVSSHLISNGVVNLDDAIAYGLAQGLSEEDAIAIGKNVYSVNKQKVFNEILSQVTSLGLDKEGAIMLAKKMGVTSMDAEAFGNEVQEMLKHYSSISQGYLDYLEQLSNKTTNSSK